MFEPEQIRKLIEQRRSINVYKPEPVPITALQQAIATSVWAPNHRMTEPWRFYIPGPETIKKICKLNADIVRAEKGEQAASIKLKKWSSIPGWLVVTCQNSDDALQQQEDYAACACVIHNLSLLLWAEGIGMKWTTGSVTRDDRFYDLIWVDRQNESVVGLIWYGYPDEQPRSNRRDASELTVDLE